LPAGADFCFHPTAVTGTETMAEQAPMSLMFRCPAELEGLIPQPVPATLGLPDWLKAMPQEAFNVVGQQETPTVKRCPAVDNGGQLNLFGKFGYAHDEVSDPLATSVSLASAPAARRSSCLARVRRGIWR
jgi:hypothetical protein